VSGLTCYEKDGELVCERDIDIELRKLKESIIRELLEKLTEELEVEITVTEPNKLIGVLKRKKVST
jgi:hypothetical protein